MQRDDLTITPELWEKNEMAWVKGHASPRMNYYVSLKDPELPDQALTLLSKYLEPTPYLVPSEPEAAANVLWHPDLHLDNIFVDPTTCKITSIVDWQSTSIAPLFYKSCVPRMFRHDDPIREAWVVPSRPDNFNTLSMEEGTGVDQDLENETIHKYYEAMQRDIQLKRKPTWLVTGVWENSDLFFLCQSLIAIAALWDTLRPAETTKCPIDFTGVELALHAKEDEKIAGIGTMLKLFQDQGVLPVDGMVDQEDYEAAKINCQKFKDIFVALAKDEEERELFSKLWPYQDQESK
ncbi:hypothetical protein D8B26_005001 [Coccidioides posadasii str. Silveira]|uniref:uncharacterized protein n=1 Tax=Coccidioides posadasii (strain RMSCC 757 / Silveira) TaxID=443226 RepID=UPI001BEE2072|nr:hypothetical protein D8B26_005001 [Coccidioides posadasii str. Silveira]